MQTINSQNFYSMISNGKAVIYFYSQGCLNCQMLDPIFHNLEKKYPAIKIYKINADTTPDLVKRLNIKSLPTLFFVVNGHFKVTLTGAQPLSVLEQTFQDWL